jgi:ornithine cyclodeaminase/alanine dehydrogenase-like protein (mu-crystallin family)
LRVAVVGAGPQAVGHVATLAAVRPLQEATYLVRDPSRAAVEAVTLGSPVAEEVLGAADVVVCATSARTPVFDSRVLGKDVVVIAVGSHEPDARELDSRLLRRAAVVVEDVGAALREAGDVVLAIAEKTLTHDELVPMADLVSGAVVVPDDQPLVFKSVGMSWQDLIVAEAVLTHLDS